MTDLTIRTIVRVAGAASVLVVALVTYAYILINVEATFWGRLLAASPLAVIILAGAIWIMSGGEKGTNVDFVEGSRRLSATNVTAIAQWFLPRLFAAWQARAIAPAYGDVGPGGPADQAGLKAKRVDPQKAIDVTDDSLLPPDDAGHLPDPPGPPPASASEPPKSLSDAQLSP
jgi:hypothetical protein